MSKINENDYAILSKKKSEESVLICLIFSPRIHEFLPLADDEFSDLYLHVYPPYQRTDLEQHLLLIKQKTISTPENGFVASMPILPLTSDIFPTA